MLKIIDCQKISESVRTLQIKSGDFDGVFLASNAKTYLPSKQISREISLEIGDILNLLPYKMLFELEPRGEKVTELTAANGKLTAKDDSGITIWDLEHPTDEPFDKALTSLESQNIIPIGNGWLEIIGKRDMRLNVPDNNIREFTFSIPEIDPTKTKVIHYKDGLMVQIDKSFFYCDLKGEVNLLAPFYEVDGAIDLGLTGGNLFLLFKDRLDEVHSPEKKIDSNQRRFPIQMIGFSEDLDGESATCLCVENSMEFLIGTDTGSIYHFDIAEREMQKVFVPESRSAKVIDIIMLGDDLIVQSEIGVMSLKKAENGFGISKTYATFCNPIAKLSEDRFVVYERNKIKVYGKRRTSEI